METNQNPAQEQPVQPIVPQTTQAAQQPDIEQIVAPAMEPAQPAAQSTAQPAPAPQPQPGRPDELLYDPDETAQMIRHLTDGYFDPEYVLLFGKLAGGTPHSDAVAYDLLIVVRETPEYDWIRAKRILRYRMPYRHRKVTYINPYILPLNYVESHRTPFLYFAHAEGELLHCSDHYLFRRPKHPIDFAKAYADAKFHFDTFRTLGNDLLEQAQDAFALGCRDYIESNFSQDLSLTGIAESFCYNPSYFSLRFSQTFGVPFSKYLSRYRIDRACELLTGTEESAASISRAVGMADPAYFNKVFKETTGMTPKRYRQFHTR